MPSYPTIFVHGIASVLVVLGCMEAGNAQSPTAKRLCKPRIEWSGLGQSKAEAQRKAIDGWSSAAAGQHGEAFTKWTIAGIARVACTLTPEGHRCKAAASPCRDLNDNVGTGTNSKR